MSSSRGKHRKQGRFSHRKQVAPVLESVPEPEPVYAGALMEPTLYSEPPGLSHHDVPGCGHSWVGHNEDGRCASCEVFGGSCKVDAFEEVIQGVPDPEYRGARKFCNRLAGAVILAGVAAVFVLLVVNF